VPKISALIRQRRYVVASRVTKSPVDPATGYESDAQNSANWLDPDVAESWATARGANYGVGIVIHEGGGLVCIDIDGALQPDGTWSLLATQLCQRFAGSYIEVSAGGRGLHIFCTVTGPIPEHRSKNTPLHIECYSRLRYILTTGTLATGDPNLIQNDAFYATLAEYFPPREASIGADGWTDTPHKDWSGPEDDAELIRRMLASRPSIGSLIGSRASVQELWHGDIDAMRRAFPSSQPGKDYDASSADQALANHLSFWFGGNCERMLGVMLQCPGLARPKWNRDDYLRRTVTRAVEGQTKFYKQRTDNPAPVATISIPPPPPPDTPAAIGLPPNVPPVNPPPATGRGFVVGTAGQLELFAGYTYLEDVYRLMSPDGAILDKGRFDARYPGRTYIVNIDGSRPTGSSWEAFTNSGVADFPRVRGMFFDPREAPQAIVTRDGYRYINSWVPIDIRAEPGDVTRFLRHLEILFPHDWRILLSYLKFMVQHKGVKATWWPFLQGVAGNGKSFISATMQYCIGKRYTQKPTPKNIDSQFNASLYGCLFVALEDVKVKDDHGALWETLKPMITETEIEIQPKGVDKVTREICFNGILNSNWKDGIRKEPDDRRLAPFFAAQQRKSDLARDGLTPSYFRDLWSWAHGDGWAHVAHYLATDPIEEQWNPATLCKVAPVTSSTADAISIGMGSAEQALIEAIDSRAPGFKGGWISSIKFEQLLIVAGKARAVPHAKRHEMLATFNYSPHPGLPGGRMPTPMQDGSLPVLYVLDGHASSAERDPARIKTLYEAAQRA
jgi:hypothetical protein